MTMTRQERLQELMVGRTVTDVQVTAGTLRLTLEKPGRKDVEVEVSPNRYEELDYTVLDDEFDAHHPGA